MFPPRMSTKKVGVRDGDLLGRENIECFLSYVGSSRNFHDKTIVERASSYGQALIMIVEELEAKFANLNPYMQQMFYNLMISRMGKKNTVLEAFTREFEGEAREAREVFSH